MGGTNKMDVLRMLDNPEEFDFEFIHKSLQTTYWAKDRTRTIVEKCFRSSVSRLLCMGDEPIAFARVMTDYAVFAYVADVFVSLEHRGHGYAKILMDSLMHDVQLSEITKWVLVTTDAHKLYEKYGFKQLEHPERYMEYFPKS